MKTPPPFSKAALLGVALFLSSCQEAKVVYEGDPHQRDAAGCTPLFEAAEKGSLSTIKLLVEAGADLNAVDDAGDTPLVHAVKSQNLPAIATLLSHGADPKVNVSTGGSLLVQALREKQLAATYLLLEKGARLHQSKGANGESLLQAATEMGNVNFLADLQTRGADLKAEIGNGHGLLHVAFDQGQYRTFNYLLEEGLDPNTKNSKQDGIVHRSVREGRTSDLPQLHENGANFDLADAQGWYPIHSAIRQGDHEMVRMLIRLGADLNRSSHHESDSVTPLELAFDQHELGIARLLLEKSVDVKDELYRAVSLGGDRGLEIVNLLIEFNVSLDPVREQDSPLALAVRDDKLEILRSLLEAGAPQDRLGISGQKPFHLAVVKEDTAMIKLLLEHGADANDPFLPSPSEEFLKYVVSSGVAKWALKKSPSLRPLMIAADSGNVPMAQLLMKHGASPGKSSKVGRHRFWPLSFAARRQDTDLQQVLFGQGPGKTKRWIRVDLSDQKAYMFEGEKTIFTTRISSGKKGNRTPTGKYVISNKYRMWHSTLYDDAEMPYFQRLSGGDFGFHYGILPGYPASHGCIRLPMSSAKKLFRLTRGGDYVEIVK